MFGRRRFLQLVGLAVTGGSLIGCQSAPADKQLDLKASKVMTVFEALHVTGNYPAIVSRQLNGQSHNFIVGVGGVYEQPELNRYWLFWVNDQPVAGPLDEVFMKNGDHLVAALMVPPQLHA